MTMNVLALKDDRHLRQFVKFVLVGLLSTAINFTVYWLCLQAELHYLQAATVAFGVATVNSYTWNRVWTFRAGKHRWSRLTRFVVVQLVGLSVNLAALTLLVEHGDLGELVAQVLANGLVVITNFSGNKFWTFRGEIDQHLR